MAGDHTSWEFKPFHRHLKEEVRPVLAEFQSHFPPLWIIILFMQPRLAEGWQAVLPQPPMCYRPVLYSTDNSHRIGKECDFNSGKIDI